MQAALRDALGTLEEDPREAQRRKILAAAGLRPDMKPIKPAPEEETEEATPLTSPKAAPADAGRQKPVELHADPAAAVSATPAPAAVPTAPRGRRKPRVTPVFIKAGMNVLATWGGKKWRAEVLRVFLDHAAAEASMAAAEAGTAAEGAQSTQACWLADVKFLSDETERKGVALTELSHTSPEYHTLEIAPELDARRRVIGTERLTRRHLCEEEDSAWRALGHAEDDGYGSTLASQRRRLATRLLGNEDRFRATLLQEESDAFDAVVRVASTSKMAAARGAEARLLREAELEHEKQRAAETERQRKHAVLLVQLHLRRQISVVVCGRALGRKLEHASRCVSIGCQTPPPEALPPPDASPRLAHFPGRRHRVIHPAPIDQRPPFRTTTLHPGFPPSNADPLPAPKSRTNSPVSGSRVRSRSHSPTVSVHSASPARRRHVSTAVAHLNFSLPGTPGNATPVRSVSPRPVEIVSSTPPPPNADRRGPTPGKPQPLPRRVNTAAPRFLAESPLRPTSLSSYLRMARRAPASQQ
jgi:hypothetical protein